MHLNRIKLITRIAEIRNNTRYTFADEKITGSIAQNTAEFVKSLDDQKVYYEYNFRETTLKALSLATVTFEECVFMNVRFEEVNLTNTSFKNCYFKDCTFRQCTGATPEFYESYIDGTGMYFCKFSEANFYETNLNSVSISNSELDGANFAYASLKHTTFTGCSLKGVDFTTTPQLYEADFPGCNLHKAKFVKPHVAKAVAEDFNRRHPEGIHAFLADVVAKDQLAMETWHANKNPAQWNGTACATTHCRAGWVIHAVGPFGYLMEQTFSAQAAGSILYFMLDPKMRVVPDFYADNETAAKDIKAYAAGTYEKFKLAKPTDDDDNF